MTASGRRALVVGKFLPPHAGHHRAIQQAGARAATVDVVVCDRPGQRPAAATRADWLRAVHPRVDVHVMADICDWHGHDPCPPRCSAAWADHLRRVGLGPWDVVCGGAEYLSRFAHELDAEADELSLADGPPVSGTAVRADLAGHWHLLDPVVRAGLTRHVVVVGAESTGTTTLAGDLAAELGVPCVPEYGRDYAARRAAEAGSLWSVAWDPEEFTHIADEQEGLARRVLERRVASAEASRPGALGPLLVHDTDVAATAVWCRRYTDVDRPDLVERARSRPRLLYVLTSPDGVAFEQDGLRDGEHVRLEMHEWFRRILTDGPVPWIEVAGSPDERVRASLEALTDAARVPLFALG